MNKEQQAAHDALIRKWTDECTLMENGFQSLREQLIHPDASNGQVEEMRMAFFAGGQHLFAAVMANLDGGPEPSKDDMARIDSLYRELDAFAAMYAKKVDSMEH